MKFHRVTGTIDESSRRSPKKHRGREPGMPTLRNSREGWATQMRASLKGCPTRRRRIYNAAQMNQQKRSIKFFCALGLFIWAFCIMAWTAKHLEPIYGWHGWLREGVQICKIVFLVYVGYQLILAEEEINSLRCSNLKSERIITELSTFK